MDSQKLKLLEDTEERHKQQIYLLEAELEEKENKYSVDLREIQDKSEEALA
mgnify:CR=1 FL=1